MKPQPHIKVGMMPGLAKWPRKSVALRMKQARKLGFKFTKYVTDDGWKCYQSNNKYDTYIYGIKL